MSVTLTNCLVNLVMSFSELEEVIELKFGEIEKNGKFSHKFVLNEMVKFLSCLFNSEINCNQSGESWVGRIIRGTS